MLPRTRQAREATPVAKAKADAAGSKGAAEAASCCCFSVTAAASSAVEQASRQALYIIDIGAHGYGADFVADTVCI